MSEKISDELQYSPVVSNHSTTIYRNISPQAAATLTLGSGAIGPTEFMIPPSVFSFEKTYLTFTVDVLAPAAGAGSFNWLYANGLSALNRVTLYDTATSNVWADISNFEKYAAMVVPASTDHEDFLTKPTAITVVPITPATAAVLPVESISRNTTIGLTHEYGVTMAGAQLDMVTDLYNKRRQFYIGGNNARTSITYNIPLADLKLTAFATKQLLYCPSNLVMQVYWSPINNIGFVATSATDPVNGAGQLPLSGVATIVAPKLVLANEGNLNIVSQVIDKVMKSGLSLPIAYPTVTVQTPPAAAPAYSLQLTRGYGQRILAMITAPFSLVATVGNNIHGRGDITQYNTTINNVALLYPPGFAASTASEDYTIANRQFLKGSVVDTLDNYVNAEWIHVDSFFGAKPLKDVNPTEIDGLDVGQQSSTWAFSGTATTQYRFVTIIVGQKILSISSQGSTVQ